MDTKALLENVRKEVQSALSKTFDKVEEFSKHQRLKLKISSIKGDIKDIKAHIGDYVYQHSQDFKDLPVIEKNLQRIEDLHNSIQDLEKEIESLKEEEEEEEDQEEKDQE